MDALFRGISGLQIVINNKGKFYVPSVIDLIDTFDPSQGYWVYDDDGGTIPFTGTTISPSTPIPVNQGWNLIPYYPETVLEPSVALANISDKMAIIQNDEGRFYIPDVISTMGIMQPGKGYNLYMNQAATLVYPSIGKTIAKASYADEPALSHFSFTGKTGGSYSVVITEAMLNGVSLEVGDEIGIYDGDLCVGAASVTGSWPLGLASWVDNSQTQSIDGYIEGNITTFRCWDASENKEIAIEGKYNSGNDKFGSGPYAQVSLNAAYIHIPKVFSLEQNYPNPFNPETLIKYQIPKSSFVTLRIYNVLGQEVITLVNKQVEPGIYSVEWDGTDNFGKIASSGIYIYRIETDVGYVESRKMLFIK